MLTEIGVERVTPPPHGKRLELWDTVVQGLLMRITHNNVKSWSLPYRINGSKQHRMHFGRFPAISVKQARALARDAKFEISQGNDPLVLREEKRREQSKLAEDNLTVAQLAKQCLERHWKLNIRCWKRMEEVFALHINPALGHMVAKDVQKKDVYKLLDKLKNSNAPYTSTQSLAALRKMYNWAIEFDLLQINPCQCIKTPVPSVARERYLNDTEIIEFCSAAKKLGYPYGHIGQLLLLTGQRRSEIAKLKWSEIDFDDKLIRLSADRIKNKRNHETPLSDLALDILKSVPRHRGAYVFTTTGGKKPVANFSSAKKEFEKHFKAKDWQFHDLRRSCATGMAMLGVTRDQIKRVLNHSDGAVTAIYDRYTYLPEKRKALDIWSHHVWGLVNGTTDNNIIKMRR